MRITVHGAGGGEVTGSAYLVQTPEANVLVDFGLFQGARKVENYNRIPKRGAFEKLNAVILTYAHLDHTGRLPLLTRAGYAGPIYATPATIDFADLIMKDSAQLSGFSAISLAVGDFNGDGISDLAAVGGGTSGKVSILLGKGDGTFAVTQTCRGAGPEPAKSAILRVEPEGLLQGADGFVQPIFRLGVTIIANALRVGDHLLHRLR
jgi:hypothetical protein